MKKGERLSEHFRLEEMCYSRTGMEKGIDNTPGREALAALKYLVTGLLEPLRKLYGKPVVVTSGFRSEEVNRLVGGVPGSQHTRGEAADCYVPDTAELLAVLRQSGLEFDQAIHYRKRNFLHLSLKKTGKNRMQVLLRLFALVFLLSGCGLSRQNHRQESAVRLDSIRSSNAETEVLKKDIRLIDTVAWNLQRIVYFAPDSAGKQYPKSVTTLQMDRSRQLTDTGKIVAHRQTDYAGRHTAETFSRAEACRTSRSPGYLFCGVALLLALSFFLYKRLKSG
ncbi:D-Ala-D-Ala carboxypeptidase family metallohydrolase [uncultured Parabacteroides sp.]|uniref:D-Ala-D-Ala carboxypeptidase family metallohydrolase n=1 Tax=uncultured Parabacteroides sp. TaxID=512312 RepID=UPI002624BAA6|nr:D-Ala-D-Ala carboxypeptidase family metallohydrolase [uncultured Parabacteroides sp.]